MLKDIFIKILNQSKNSNNILIYDKNIKYKAFYNLTFKYLKFFKSISLKKNSVICVKMNYSRFYINNFCSIYK